MTRRDWWLGVTVVVMTIGLHAAYPRYDWRPTSNPGATIRIDRWTGEAVLGRHSAQSNGHWEPVTSRDSTAPKPSDAYGWFGKGEVNWPKTLLLIGAIGVGLLLVVWASVPYFRRSQPHDSERRHDNSRRACTSKGRAAATRSSLVSPVTGWIEPDEPLHPRRPDLAAKVKELGDQHAKRVSQAIRNAASSRPADQTEK
jgi:hypothetical protein